LFGDDEEHSDFGDLAVFRCRAELPALKEIKNELRSEKLPL
jgi:hypothetical protein